MSIHSTKSHTKSTRLPRQFYPDNAENPWCQWCGADINPGPARHCNPGCLQDNINDARLDNRWTELEWLYELRAKLSWPNLLNRRQLARSHNRVEHRKGAKA